MDVGNVGTSFQLSAVHFVWGAQSAWCVQHFSSCSSCVDPSLSVSGLPWRENGLRSIRFLQRQERVDFIETLLGDNAQKHSEARLRAFSLTAWSCQRLRECRLCRLCRLCQCMSEWDIWWYLAQGGKRAPDSRFPPLGLASKVCWVDHGPLRRPCCKSTASNAPWCLCHRAPWKAWLPPLAELPSWGQRIQASFKKVWAPSDWWWWVLQGGTSSGQSRDEEKDRAEFGAWSFQSHLFPSSSSEKAAQQSLFRSLTVWSWLLEPRRDGNDGRTGLLDPAGGNWWLHLPSGSSPCS